jgi:hypothetical protein
MKKFQVIWPISKAGPGSFLQVGIQQIPRIIAATSENGTVLPAWDNDN